MSRKPPDRRPDGSPAEQRAGKYDPSRPEPGRRVPEIPEENEAFGTPEGRPIDRQVPGLGMRAGHPVPVEEDDEEENIEPGEVDTGPGWGGHRPESDEGRGPRQVEPTRR